VIVGAGGHGRERADVVDAVNAVSGRLVWDLKGFIDDGHPDLSLLERRGERFLGTSEALANLAGYAFVAGVGSPQGRRSAAAVAEAAGLEAVALVHPSSVMGRDVVAAPGLVVCAFVSVTTHVTLGSHVHLNRSSTVGHDVVIGDFVTLNPGSVVSGNVTLEDDVTLGTHAAVIQGLRVGVGSVVGAGAVVVRDIPPGVTAVGVPARPLAKS
jgi:sugar O-acyltransferase (sialic acid O-acetyltransferase NeuD family)